MTSREQAIKHNPLTAFTIQFQDGCQLGLRVDPPVPQVDAMAALGHFAAAVGMSGVDFTLPRQPVELVVEAILKFIEAHQDESWVTNEQFEALVRDMARAVLDAVMMPEPEMEEACSTLLTASQAQHDGLDLLFARLAALDKDFRPSESGQPWEALVMGNAAREKARRVLLDIPC